MVFQPDHYIVKTLRPPVAECWELPAQSHRPSKHGWERTRGHVLSSIHTWQRIRKRKRTMFLVGRKATPLCLTKALKSLNLLYIYTPRFELRHKRNLCLTSVDLERLLTPGIIFSVFAPITLHYNRVYLFQNIFFVQLLLLISCQRPQLWPVKDFSCVALKAFILLR